MSAPHPPEDRGFTPDLTNDTQRKLMFVLGTHMPCHACRLGGQAALVCSGWQDTYLYNICGEGVCDASFFVVPELKK